ncbi:hypothetical protein M011DRAFT_45202 [Sporormia fimetaria CBS 119925]|uniref:Transmembrane protein n=1 Tax=Sporormia fimetaria CBS 119925 TaxID=1340428 RepID=A0A6A6VAB2_9PLEO|nr:hypothetical protein M011DRAFT_45202 [Sporormia fimetaria CBS 119925]
MISSSHIAPLSGNMDAVPAFHNLPQAYITPPMLLPVKLDMDVDVVMGHIKLCSCTRGVMHTIPPTYSFPSGLPRSHSFRCIACCSSSMLQSMLKLRSSFVAFVAFVFRCALIVVNMHVRHSSFSELELVVGYTSGLLWWSLLFYLFLWIRHLTFSSGVRCCWWMRV